MSQSGTLHQRRLPSCPPQTQTTTINGIVGSTGWGRELRIKAGLDANAGYAETKEALMDGRIRVLSVIEFVDYDQTLVELLMAAPKTGMTVAERAERKMIQN